MVFDVHDAGNAQAYGQTAQDTHPPGEARGLSALGFVIAATCSTQTGSKGLHRLGRGYAQQFEAVADDGLRRQREAQAGVA